MPLERPPDSLFTEPLAHRLTENATAAEIASACAAICAEVDAALKPIIGSLGASALFRRSLHLANASHPWLVAAPSSDPFTFDAALLRDALAQRRSDEAAAAANCFLQTLHKLLVSLIGASLTERLLRAAWGPPTTAVSASTQAPPP